MQRGEGRTRCSAEMEKREVIVVLKNRRISHGERRLQKVEEEEEWGVFEEDPEEG